MTEPDMLLYELVALGGASDHASSWRSLGRFPDLPAAARGRVEDVLTQLAAHDGWLIRTEHIVVGPSPAGPAVVASYVSELGADPARGRVPGPVDVAGSRGWLLAGHGLV